ncbi:MAG: hypothetical protein HC867_04075 [Bacteroidia bacterium]|nr:hypothetical protein [Bacteroidia bacterium]
MKKGITEDDLLMNREGYLNSGYVEYLAGLLLDKAEAYLLKYNYSKQKPVLNQALKIYKITDLIFDKIKTYHSEVQSKLFWRTNTRRLYEHAIEASYLSGQPQEVFYFLRKAVLYY